MAEIPLLEFAVETLVSIINENCKLIAGARKDSEHLVGELNHLKAFLNDAAKYRRSISDKWNKLVKEVHVLVYKAERLIDTLLVEVKLHQDKNKVKQFFDLKYGKSVRDLAVNIKDALEEVKKIRAENPQAFEAKPMLDDLPEMVAPGRQDPLLEENEVVGFDEEARKVIKRLDGGTNDLDVIPVVGLPGLGKTTLAVKIFRDPDLSYKFFKSIWVYVGQQYKLKEVLLNILGGFTKTCSGDYHSMDENELSEKICEFISKGGKCLIVLDDVWKPEIVDDVKKVFPKNSKGHRIMLTTRMEPVGRYANADPHSLKFLTDDESFQLLENRVFRSDIRKCPEDLVAHGKSIAIKCGGVPLAVVVIAGALKGRTLQSEWKIVKDNVGERLISRDDPESCLGFVGTSYDHLRNDMKMCFLYCGAFPQGFEIPAWKLIRLWISERLIDSKSSNTSPEDIAEHYLNDLVSRNLVMVMRKSADGRVKTCRIHDMLHQFCKMEAKNGVLFQEVCGKTDGSRLDIPEAGSSHRLCIQLPLLETFINEIKGQPAEHVRSVLCFSTKQKGSEHFSNIRDLHKAFPLVSVLDVESLKFNFSSVFQKRFYLRYIAISGDYNDLPVFFGEFFNLQTLIINTEKSTITIKADILKMQQLRHLHTNAPAVLLPPSTTKTAADEPSCLQTLSKVAPESCRKDVLARACNLRKVNIQGQMADFFDTKKGKFRNFEKLKRLENLRLFNDNGSLQLPPDFFKFLRKLRKLTLKNTRFAWSDADKLGKLECLEVLKLKENAFVGSTWDSEGFSQLKVLWIERADFETWRVSTHPFQRLKCLVLISCVKLEAVPIELADVRSLQEMRLVNTKKGNQSAKAIEGKKNKEMQERTQKAAESTSGRKSQAPEISKFTLTIFPPEPADCNATE